MKLYTVVMAEDLLEVREKGLEAGYAMATFDEAVSWIYEEDQVLVEAVIENPEKELEVDEEAGEQAWRRLTDAYHSAKGEKRKAWALKFLGELEEIYDWEDSLRFLGSAESLKRIPPQRISVIIDPDEESPPPGAERGGDELKEELGKVEPVPILGLPALFWVWLMYLTQAILVPADRRQQLEDMAEETFVKRARKIQRTHREDARKKKLL